MTGMRVSECLSLTFEDFDGKYIHIRRQYIRGKWQTINDNLNMYINDHLRMYTSDYTLI